MYKEEYGMYFCDVCGTEITKKEKYPLFKDVDLCPDCSREWEEAENE